MPPSRKKKVGQERQDKYYHLAKEYGYRSRAAFKLIQLNKKYDFLSRAQCVVDLCAAPGGWLQVARKYMPMTGVLIGVDLANIRNIKNVKCITGDITTKKCLAEIKQELMGHKVDVVLHDGAPNVGSNWLKDAYTQSELVLSSLKMACDLLRPKGIFVTKVFRSNDYTALLWLFNQFFEKVEATKPKASRYTSAEIYVIGFGYKAPKEIDAKLFNPNFVFEEVAPKTKLELGYQKKLRKQKKAEGYDEEFEGTVIRKKASVAKFINSNVPVSFAAEHNVLEFDEEAHRYLEHPETTNEIKELCKDLQRMGRYDFKVLLRWRQKMIEFRDEVDGVDGATTGGESEYEQLDEPMQDDMKDGEGEKEVDEEELQRELEELRKKSLKMKKQLQKRRKEKEKKRMPRADLLTEEKGDLLDTYTGGKDELFSLKTIKSVEDLKRSTEGVEKDLDYISLQEEHDDDDDEEPNASDDDDVDDDERWDQLIEQNLDKQYEYYLESKSSQRRKLEKMMKKKEKQREELMEALKHDEEHNFEQQEGKNPLIAEFENSTSESRKESQWFGQNIFNVLKEDAEERATKKRKLESGEGESTKKDVDLGYDDDDLPEEQDDDDDSSDDGDYEELKNKMKELNKEEGDGFEIVPQDLHDENTRATTIAIAKKLLKKKQRRQFVDDAYNRYAFNDDDLPKWFVEDELKHMKRIPMVTKEEVEKEKQLERELNARPAKKVLEAQLRKKKKTANKLKKVQEKATQIAENHEMTAREKQQELEKLYKKATKEDRKTVKVVSTKGRTKEGVSRTTGGAKVKYVDRRAKKDARHNKKTEQKMKKRKRK